MYSSAGLGWEGSWGFFALVRGCRVSPEGPALPTSAQVVLQSPAEIQAREKVLNRMSVLSMK